MWYGIISLMTLSTLCAIQAVLCALPQCAPGVESATPIGECCPQCGEFVCPA